MTKPVILLQEITVRDQFPRQSVDETEKTGQSVSVVRNSDPVIFKALLSPVESREYCS